MASIAILDIDGTLVDTNYHHTLAWQRALREHAVVLASSAKSSEVDVYLDLLEARDVVDDWTTSADVEATKPEPDLVVAALDKAGGGRDAVMLGLRTPPRRDQRRR